MIKNTQKTISGYSFHVTEFPAFTAIKIKARIARLIGPAFGGLLGAVSKLDKGKKASDMDISALAPAIELLAATLDPEAFANLCLELMSGTVAVIENQKYELANVDQFNKAFTGRLDLMYKVIYFVLEVNDFFGLSSIGKAAGVFGQTKLPNPGSNLPKES